MFKHEPGGGDGGGEGTQETVLQFRTSWPTEHLQELSVRSVHTRGLPDMRLGGGGGGRQEEPISSTPKLQGARVELGAVVKHAHWQRGDVVVTEVPRKVPIG
jgi:hypothetical protein